MSSAESSTPDALSMDGIHAKAKEIVEDANALLLVALHSAIETELKKREQRLDTCEDAKIRSGQELRRVRDFVRGLED